MKCPKSGTFVNNYWIRLVGQSNFAGQHGSFFWALLKYFSGNDGSALLEKIDPYAYEDMEYECRLRKHCLWTLEECRNTGDLLEVFKMYTGLSIMKFESLFKSAISYTNKRP